MVVGVTVAVGGAVGSFYADTAPGALIVVLAIGGLRPQLADLGAARAAT